MELEMKRWNCKEYASPAGAQFIEQETVHGGRKALPQRGAFGLRGYFRHGCGGSASLAGQCAWHPCLRRQRSGRASPDGVARCFPRWQCWRDAGDGAQLILAAGRLQPFFAMRRKPSSLSPKCSRRSQSCCVEFAVHLLWPTFALPEISRIVTCSPQFCCIRRWRRQLWRWWLAVVVAMFGL